MAIGGFAYHSYNGLNIAVNYGVDFSLILVMKTALQTLFLGTAIIIQSYFSSLTREGVNPLYALMRTASLQSLHIEHLIQVLLTPYHHQYFLHIALRRPHLRILWPLSWKSNNSKSLLLEHH